MWESVHVNQEYINPQCKYACFNPLYSFLYLLNKKVFILKATMLFFSDDFLGSCGWYRAYPRNTVNT